jgi:putative hydroxymethylpyrimidine transport system permease protein
MSLLRAIVVVAGLIAAWELVVRVTRLPPYLLPAPGRVAAAWFDYAPLLVRNALLTGSEILLGLALGAALGTGTAIAMASFRPARRWLLPLLVISQAVPVFALAPLLVLWFGYGMASKIAMATLIIYFPVTAAFTDGLRRTDPDWLDLARTMGGSRRTILRHIRLPSALPALASGLRVATAVAPIGAVIGEWVGSSAGLGFLMLHANARMQIDLMFAALLTLAVLAVALYFSVDALLSRALPWLRETAPADDHGR